MRRATRDRVRKGKGSREGAAEEEEDEEGENAGNQIDGLRN